MNADVVIIGAGLAGLRCGIELLHKRPSLNIVILEKYKYLGGRVVTFRKTIEDIEGRCAKLQWENGAGRVSEDHTLVKELIKKYKLTKIPLGEGSLFAEHGTLQENTFEESLGAFLPEVKRLSAETLASNTLRTLFWKILGHRANDLFIRFGYRAEVDVLRADLGIQSFEKEMGANAKFFVVREGLSSLVDGMVAEFKQLGGKIFNKQEVIEIQFSENRFFVRTQTDAGDVLWEAPKVICALHSEALRKISLFKNFSVLKHLKMEPLLRVYAVFPTEKGASWFSDLPRVVTDNPVRYFIPINPACGTAMISYTDSNDARKLMKLLDEQGEEALEAYLLKYLRSMFPEKEIPDPLFFKTHPWTYGCTYWLPGEYDPKEESIKSLQPFPDTMPGLYCCGESFSLKQAWMEGALESADALMAKHF